MRPHFIAVVEVPPGTQLPEAPPISSPVSMTGRSRSTPICSGAGAWRGSVASGRAATGSMSRPYSDQWPSWSEMTWREESEVNSGWSSEIPGSVGLGSPGSDLRGRSMPSPLSTATAGVAGVRTSTSHRVVPSQGMFGCSQPMNARVLPSGDSLGQAMKWEWLESTFVVPCLVSSTMARSRRVDRQSSRTHSSPHGLMCRSP